MTALDRVADAMFIARHARNFQEAIDVAVILNALRALGGGEVPTTQGR